MDHPSPVLPRCSKSRPSDSVSSNALERIKASPVPSGAHSAQASAYVPWGDNFPVAEGGTNPASLLESHLTSQMNASMTACEPAQYAAPRGVSFTQFSGLGAVAVRTIVGPSERRIDAASAAEVALLRAMY